VAVADAVAVGGNADGGHAFHEAGGKAAEPAVAEGGIGLELGDRVVVDAEHLQRLAHRLGEPEVRHGIAHQAPDQELEAEVVDALRARFVGLARRGHPALDRPVAHDQDRGLQPVVRLRDRWILADAIEQPLDDLAREAFGIVGARGGAERCLQGFGHGRNPPDRSARKAAQTALNRPSASAVARSRDSSSRADHARHPATVSTPPCAADHGSGASRKAATSARVSASKCPPARASASTSCHVAR
jgi:hypothetical protein